MNQIVPVQEIRGEARVSSRDQQTPFFLLAEGIRYALNGDIRSAAQCLKEAERIAQPDQLDDVHLLKLGVISEISIAARSARPSKANPHNEFAVVHYWFKNHFSEAVQGAKLVRFDRRAGSNPDFMLRVDGEQRPVECKRIFNARALNQLLSYLTAYGATHGYAVALRLICALPPNITFIECPAEAAHD